jgi:hypothetical protein
METQLYVRIRGRVMGPYDKDKLQGLARRGQLSRMHELSPDATQWVRASTYPELFVTEEAPAGAVPQPAGDGRAGAAVDARQPAPGRRWWYRKNGVETGPVDQATVQQGIAAGLLNGDDLVWADGLPQWLPARYAPGLTVPSQNAPWTQQSGGTSPVGAADEKAELPIDLCKAATSSRPWLILLAVVAFLFTGIAIALGIFMLIYGGRAHTASVVAGGLFWLIYGLDLAAGGFLLVACATRTGGLRFSRHPMVMERSLDATRSFLIYVGINLIVFLAFLVSALIWIIASGTTIPWL